MYSALAVATVSAAATTTTAGKTAKPGKTVADYAPDEKAVIGFKTVVELINTAGDVKDKKT